MADRPSTRVRAVIDRVAAASAIDAFLRAIGRDPAAEPALLGTGERVTDAFVDELCEGYAVDVDALLEDNVITGNFHSVVVVRELAVATTCPHHLLPSFGVATVAFEPRGRVLGLGAIGRLVDAWSRRLALQEEIGERIVESLTHALAPEWAACRLVLTHACMFARGERRHGVHVETVCTTRGLDPDERLRVERILGTGT